VTTVHVVVPDGVDDPQRPSGGNAYDRQVCGGLADLGWSVLEHAVPGPWPRPDPSPREALAGVLAGAPDGAVVLLDGLVASAVPEVLVPEARRLKLVVLVHMPRGLEASAADPDGVCAREQEVLSAAAAVVTTSRWTRTWLLDHYALRAELVGVAEPGVDPADVAPGTRGGGDLLCVAAVTPVKGHDVLVDALAEVSDLPWRCTWVGSLTRDREFVEHLRSRIRECGLEGRVRLMGPLTGLDLHWEYAAADALVLASRAETYGMVVTEALARGLPVIGTTAGGLPEAVGRAPAGRRPGLLVPPGDPAALAAALRCWLLDHGLRRGLRHAARERRDSLTGWSETAGRLERILAGVVP